MWERIKRLSSHKHVLNNDNTDLFSLILMQCDQSINLALCKAKIGPSGTFFTWLSQQVYVQNNYEFCFLQMENKVYRQPKLNSPFFSCEKASFLLSSRSRCKALWIQVDISQAFLYHLKAAQCFLNFNLISWYYQTCVSLTSPCFSALLVELHRTFLEKREGILKYSVWTVHNLEIERKIQF